VRAPRDPYDAALTRGDDLLGRVHATLRALVGDEAHPRLLQAPVSFRVVGPALAHLLRSVGHLDAAAERSLTGVSTSPALVAGRFLGTAGFDGFDLAASLDALRVSLIHLAETSAHRLHRLLDDRFTALPRQLSDAPGLHAGMVVVHKRAVGVVHALLRGSAPASVGAIETSLGQEDVQSFSLEAAAACADAVEGVRDVLACELLAVLHGGRLAAAAGALASQDGPPSELAHLLDEASAVLPPGTADRPFGRDVAALSALLASGWAPGILAAGPSNRAG
jgi:histidine ammonia-lyase